MSQNISQVGSTLEKFQKLHSRFYGFCGLNMKDGLEIVKLLLFHGYEPTYGIGWHFPFEDYNEACKLFIEHGALTRIVR